MNNEEIEKWLAKFKNDWINIAKNGWVTVAHDEISKMDDEI
jgi:hypothetical protein